MKIPSCQVLRFIPRSAQRLISLNSVPRSFKMIAQCEGCLGIRLLGASQYLFSIGCSVVCLIESHSPALPFHYLQELATFLKEPKDRMVIGPTLDGGYYALGLRHAHPRLFEDVTWSTDRVYSETSKELSRSICRPLCFGTMWMTISRRCVCSSELFPECAIETEPQGSPASIHQRILTPHFCTGR
jgi:Uncharacterized protein conserved in bacteria (DUF2064)